ncbi:MAG: hypothetical protein ACLRSL_07375 [Streptococcus sp.]
MSLPDNGTPWQAIRFTTGRCMKVWIRKRSTSQWSSNGKLSNHFVQVSKMFRQYHTDSYADKEATSPIATMTADQAGNLILNHWLLNQPHLFSTIVRKNLAKISVMF